MVYTTLKKTAIFAGCTLLLCLSRAAANTVTAVSVEPTFECAGVIASLGATDDPGTVTLEVKKTGEATYRRAHDFVRYDNGHMASSLFDLAPGTAYDIRVTLGGRATYGSFSTRPEFILPAPLRTVAVRNAAELNTAIQNAQPGDEILLSPGTYAGGFTVAASGTAEHPVVIRGNIPASEKSKPVDQRTGLPIIDGSGKNAVVTVSGAHVVLDSLRLENISLEGIVLSGTKYDVVQGCQVTGASSGWNHFIYVNGGGAAGGRHLIQDNYVRDTGSGSGYGIYQNNYPGPGTVIRRNIITGCYDSINPSGNEQDLTDANVPLTHPDVLGTWPNHSTDVYENTVHISRDDDIEMDGIAVNTRVFRNYLSPAAGDYCTNTISIAPVAPGPFFFVRNVVTNFHEGAVKYNTLSNRGTIRNCFFYHNTIKNDLGTEVRGTLLTLWEGAGDEGSPSQNTVFKNNIFSGDQMLIERLVSVHTPAYDPNIWYTKRASGTLYQWGKTGPYYTTFDAWRTATGEEPHGLYADARVGTDFRLSANSPAIDKGVVIPGINDAYAGAAPDMGAFEYGAATVANDTNPSANPQTYSLGGYVRDAALAAIPGATVQLSGAASRSLTSDANGHYQFTGLPEGSYSITIQKTGYAFAPAVRSISSPAAGTSQDFTGTAIAAAAVDNLDRAFGFPNPLKPGGSAPFVTFMNITKGTRVRIFTLNAELVRELYDPEATELRWDVMSDNVASGVYVCVLTNDKGQKKQFKVAVIR